MTSGSPLLADLYAADHDEAVLRVLREADRPLTAIEVKRALLAGGVDKSEVDGSWPAVRKRIRNHDHVVVADNRYRWTAGSAAPQAPTARDTEQTPPPGAPDVQLSAAEALELIVNGRLAAPKRAALADVIRSALNCAGRPADPAGSGGQPADDERARAEAAARQRQAEIDAVRLLAELASEVEELVGNETEPAVMIRQVRAWVRRSGLDPVGRAGEETRFDRKIHKPIGGAIRDGAPVIVVRPGYVWKAQDRDVLLGKAVVEE